MAIGLATSCCLTSPSFRLLCLQSSWMFERFTRPDVSDHSISTLNHAFGDYQYPGLPSAHIPDVHVNRWSPRASNHTPGFAGGILRPTTLLLDSSYLIETGRKCQS
ncbi:hypothetical protein EV363DRAFT_1391955 [Boletus edulis]|nr:hypothetical protein EV363DRAFT_1391955 [Boletus edulis]